MFAKTAPKGEDSRRLGVCRRDNGGEKSPHTPLRARSFGLREARRLILVGADKAANADRCLGMEGCWRWAWVKKNKKTKPVNLGPKPVAVLLGG